MEKHIANKDIIDGCLYVEFERRDNVDMRKHRVRVGRDACKELRLLHESTCLIGRPLRWILCIVMVSIIIRSKGSRPCHVCGLWSSFAKLCWIVFETSVYAELTSNRDHS